MVNEASRPLDPQRGFQALPRAHRRGSGRGPVFVAHGMLINVLLAVNATEHLDESAGLEALAVCTFGNALAAAQAGSEVPFAVHR